MSYENPTAAGKQSDLSSIIAQAAKPSKQETQKQARVSANAASLAQGVLNSITPKKNALKDFTATQKNKQQNLYNDIASYDLGYKDFDKQSDTFFHNLIDKYSEIQGHLNNGTLVDEQLGRKDLAKINNLVNVYGDAIPRMLKISQAIETASKDPNSPQLSITGPPVDQMKIITKITNGEKVDIIQEGDSIILKDPETGTILNVAEFNKAFSNNKNPYLKYEADVSKPLGTAFTSYMKDKENNFTSAFTTPEKIKNRNGDEVEITTMTIPQQVALKKSMIGIENKSTGVPDGQFTALINEEGESIWEDLMDGGRGYDVFTEEEGKGPALEWFAGKNGVPVPGDDEFPLYKKQYETMLAYLSEKSLQDNAASEGIKLITENKVSEPEDDNENVNQPKTQKEFNKQWNSLKPGEKLTGPNGVEYEKK